jgi:hypothetical protein
MRASGSSDPTRARITLIDRHAEVHSKMRPSQQKDDSVTSASHSEGTRVTRTNRGQYSLASRATVRSRLYASRCAQISLCTSLEQHLGSDHPRRPNPLLDRRRSLIRQFGRAFVGQALEIRPD